MKPCDGIARKITTPFLFLSGAGWIMFIVAFGWLNNNGFYDEGTALQNPFEETDDENRVHGRWFPFWSFAVSSPVLYLLAFIHLLTGQWYIGFFSHVCTALVLVSGGGVLFWNGHVIAQINDFGDGNFQIIDSEEGRLHVVEFTGCLVAVVFMTVAMALWPFFTDVNNYECIGYQRTPATTTTVRAPAPQPHVYVAAPGQAIPMQPMVFAQQQAYPQGGVYPATLPNVHEDKTRLVNE